MNWRGGIPPAHVGVSWLCVTYLQVEPDEQMKASCTAPVHGPLRLQQWLREHGDVGVPAMFSVAGEAAGSSSGAVDAGMLWMQGCCRCK